MIEKNKNKRPAKRPARKNNSKIIAPSISDNKTILYGIHAVKAALYNKDRKIEKVLATKNAADRLRPVLEKRDLSAEITTAEEISTYVGKDAVHQGMALITSPSPALDIHDIKDARLIIVLDQLTDPHNVGAIIRSAVALGAEALITTYRNAPKETGLLAKTASGGMEHLKLVHVGNLAQSLTKLTDFGFTLIGLDSEGPQNLKDSLMGNKIALVLGSEGSGLRRLTRERCDILARLNMPGPIKSLNVSNAAALSLYLASDYLNEID